MDIFKRPAVIAIVIIAILAAVVWSYLDKRQENKKAAEQTTTAEIQPITNLTNADPEDFSALLADELTLAGNKAGGGWQVAALEVEIPAGLSVNSGTSRYVYTNESDTANNWAITFSQTSGNYIRALIPKEDYLGEIQPINTALWKFNYITALQLAEKNGGLVWREDNELVGVKLTLRHTPPKNWLLWTVEYAGKNGKLTKTIDANSGQIIEATQ
ncbi:MAG: hypothetical protein AAB360_02470 [Patescibacteria group bacterium]